MHPAVFTCFLPENTEMPRREDRLYGINVSGQSGSKSAISSQKKLLIAKSGLEKLGPGVKIPARLGKKSEKQKCRETHESGNVSSDFHGNAEVLQWSSTLDQLA